MIYKLSDIFDLQMGKTPTRSDLSYWQNGSYDWISISDLNTDRKYISDTKERITTKAVRESGIKKIPANTVIMSFKLSMGKTAITSHDMFSNEAIMAFIDRKVIRINPDYIYYLLHALDWNKRANKAVKGRTVNKKIISQTQVNIPDYQTQLRIVKIMDSTRKRVKIQKDILSKLDTLIKARFVEMFGDIKNNKNYNYKLISDLTNVVSGGTPKRDVKEYWDRGTIPWVKTTELKNNKVNSTEEYITKTGLQNSSAKLVPSHTILIAMYGQGKTRGMTAYLEKEAATNQACACILPCSKINSEYLWQYLIMSYEELRNLAKGGNQPNLNSRMIKDFPILDPPIALQNKFVSFIHQVDKSKVAIQKSLDETQTLFDSLMQKYFS